MTKRIHITDNSTLTSNLKPFEWELILNTAQLGYWKLNLKTHMVERSLLYDQIFGYLSFLPKWTDQTFLSHIHPKDRSHVDTLINDTIEHKSHCEFQCRIVRVDDKNTHWIWVSAQVVEINQTLYMLGLIQDITQRKNTELEHQKKSVEYTALLEATPDCLFITNRDGLIVFTNQTAAEKFGYLANELFGQSMECLMPERFQSKHVSLRKQYDQKPIQRPMGSGLELFGMHKDGHEFPVEISLGPVQTDNELLVIVIVRDITERRHLETVLAESEMRWKFALENSNQGVWDWHVPEKIIYFSHAWKSMLGYADDEVGNEQSEFESRVHPDDLERVLKCVNDHFEQKTSEYSCEVRFRCKDGHYKWILDQGKVISRSPDGKPLRAIGTHNDISDLKIKEEQLKHLAEHDIVTGLINRTLYEDRLAQAFSIAKRNTTHVAVCFIDIDDFKHINDTHGHAIGDLLLLASANCMQIGIRDEDTLARFGGDEFALILLNIKTEQDVLTILKKMVGRFAEGFLIENLHLKITLSIGIALYPKDGDKALIKKADIAMYYVKKHGKNNIKFYNYTF